MSSPCLWGEWGAVVCVDGVERRAQHTSLRRSSAEGQAGGLMWAQARCLRAVFEEVSNPFAQVVVDGQMKGFGEQLVGNDCVKC